MDQIEAEVENEDNEEEVNFEVNWRNDFEELEKALEDDSGEVNLFPGCTRQGSTHQDTTLSSFEIHLHVGTQFSKLNLWRKSF